MNWNDTSIPPPLQGAVALGSVLLVLLSISLGPGPLQKYAIAEPQVLLISLAFGVLVVRSAAGRRILRTVSGLVYESPSPAFHITLGVLGFAVSILFSRSLFHGVPFLDDGVSALFQARLFARGELTTTIPRYPRFFHQIFVLDSLQGLDHRCSMYPPGWPALLTPGVLLGAPWLVNPVLAGLLLVVMSILGDELYDPFVGRTAGLLGLSSPFITVLSGTHLSHTATMLLCTLCAWATLRLLRSGRWIFGPVAGLSWGMAFLCRPLTALAVGLIIAAGCLVRFRLSLKAWRGILAALAPALAAAVILGAYQQHTTGDFRTPGHRIGMRRGGAYGFIRVDDRIHHTPERGFRHTVERLRAVNDHLIGWPFAALLLALAPLVIRNTRWIDLWLLLPMLALLVAYAGYWYLEFFFPARYLAASVPFLLILMARGLDILRTLPSRGDRWARSIFPGIVLASIFFAVVTLHQVFLVRYRGAFGDVEPNLARIVKRFDIRNAVVFMDSINRDPRPGLEYNDYYATGFLRNDIDLQGDVVYARNRREENRILIDAYPGRRYYLYRFNRRTHEAQLSEIIPREDGEEYVKLYPEQEGSRGKPTTKTE